MFLANWNFSRLAVLLPLVLITASHGQSGSRTIANPSQSTQADKSLVTLTVDMDEKKLALLRQKGSLRVAIPPVYRGRVDAVRLKYAVSFKSEDALLHNAVDKLNNTVTVTFSDETLDQLEYQPVKAKVYYSGFSNVLLVYKKRKAGEPRRFSETENQPTTADSVRVFARVDDNRGLHGWMTGLAKIELKSEFGDVKINSTDIAGIKLNANGSGSVSIRLNSGTTVSGYLNFDEIRMKCSWGKQTLSLSELDSIVTDRKFHFATDPLHPGRWIFETDLANQPPPPSAILPTIPAVITPIPAK